MKDLAYKVTKSKGIRCKFTLTVKGLHILKVDEDTNGCFFGRKIPDNGTNFGLAMFYTIISESIDEVNESENKQNNLTGILRSILYEDNDSNEENDSIIGVIRANTVNISDIDNEGEEVEGSNLTRVNEEEVAIETLEASKKCFSKRDRLKAEMAQRFQHIAKVPSDATLIHSVNANRIRNNPITKRNILIAQEMLE